MNDYNEKYPLAMAEIRQWIINNLIKSTEYTEDEQSFVDNMAKQIDTIIEATINNPRNLFDYFDDHKIFISIDVALANDQDFPDVIWKFEYNIYFNDVSKNPVESEKYYRLRKEAEQDALEDALLALNEQISRQQEKDKK